MHNNVPYVQQEGRIHRSVTADSYGIDLCLTNPPMSKAQSSHIVGTSASATRCEVLMDSRSVEYTAAKFARKRNLSHHNQEDIAADFMLELCKAAKRYDPSRSSPKHYMNQVRTKVYLHQCRKYGVKQRRPKSVALDEARDVESTRSHTGSKPDLCPCLMRRLASSLPPDLRELVVELRYKSLATIAKEAGVDPGTISRRVARIKEIIERQNSSDDF